MVARPDAVLGRECADFFSESRLGCGQYKSPTPEEHPKAQLEVIDLACEQAKKVAKIRRCGSPGLRATEPVRAVKPEESSPGTRQDQCDENLTLRTNP